MIEFIPQGVCAKKIEFDVEDNKLKSVSFAGGCNGNLKAISKLIEGMAVSDVISKLEGNTCHMRNTSCTDQLAQALKQNL